MKKILHVCVDEKFIDFAISSFDSIESVINDFKVISPSKNLKYIKSKNVTVHSKINFTLEILKGNIEKYDAVIFHSMQETFKFFLKLIPSKVTVCWIGFGFDYYEKPNSLTNNLSNAKSIKDFLKVKVLKLNSSYEKVNFFSPVLEEEFLPVSKRLNLKAKFIDWNYGSSNNLIQSLKTEFVYGDSILLGNSADPTNNHIEIIQQFINYGEKREVVIPLSYGGSEAYINAILSLLKSSELNFTVLTDFKTQEEYFNILKRCSFVIMNHERQQAMGNIIMMLSLGAKVVINEQNIACGYVNNMGFKFVKKGDIKSNLSAPLSQEQILLNKTIALKNFNSKVTKRKTKALISTLCRIEMD